MKKGLKIGLALGATALLVITAIYFVTRKPSEKSTDENTNEEENKPEADKETKNPETKPKQTKSNPSKTTATTKPTPTTTAPTTPTPKKSLKGFSVSGVISKTENPTVYKGRVVVASKDKTILMGANGKQLFELKRGTNVGKITGSSLTKTGNYLITVQMNNGKSVLVNGDNLIFA